MERRGCLLKIYFGGKAGLAPLTRMPAALAALLFCFVPLPDFMGVFWPYFCMSLISLVGLPIFKKNPKKSN